MKTPQLSKDDVKHLADLSALKLTDEEIETFRKQFDETLEFIKNLEELDTGSVDHADHLSGQKNIFFEDSEKNERLLSEDEAVKNSKKHEDGYFVVDRII